MGSSIHRHQQSNGNVAATTAILLSVVLVSFDVLILLFFICILVDNIARRVSGRECLFVDDDDIIGALRLALRFCYLASPASAAGCDPDDPNNTECGYAISLQSRWSPMTARRVLNPSCPGFWGRGQLRCLSPARRYPASPALKKRMRERERERQGEGHDPGTGAPELDEASVEALVPFRARARTDGGPIVYTWVDQVFLVVFCIRSGRAGHMTDGMASCPSSKTPLMAGCDLTEAETVYRDIEVEPTGLNSARLRNCRSFDEASDGDVGRCPVGRRSYEPGRQ